MKYLSIILVSILMCSCSLIRVDKNYYKKDLPTPPSEKELSFVSKQAMATGATLNSVVASKVYYKGTEAESDDAKILWEMSYRFMDLAGVSNDFDPQDPESIKKVFSKADKALEEKDKNLHKLKEDVKQYQKDLIKSSKMIKDREAEALANEGKWQWRWGMMFYGIIAFIIFVIVGLGVAQAYTGIPFLKGIFTGFSTLRNAVSQSMNGLSKIKQEMQEVFSSDNSTPAEKESAEKWLGKLKNKIDVEHDASVKKMLAVMNNKKKQDKWDL